MVSFIQYMSRSQAENSAKTDFPGDMAAIISISDPGKPKPAPDSSFDEKIFLAFSDTNDEFSLERMAVDKDSEIAKIVGFIDRIHRSKRIYSLVVHCNFGLSRSCAVAKYAAKATGANFIIEITEESREMAVEQYTMP